MTVDPYLNQTVQVILRSTCCDLSEWDKRFLQGYLGRLSQRGLSEKQFSTLGQITAMKFGFTLDGPQSVFEPRMEPSERSQQFDYLLGYRTRQLNRPDSDGDSELTEIPCSTSVRNSSTKGVLEVIRSPPSTVGAPRATQAAPVGQSQRRSHYG